MTTGRRPTLPPEEDTGQFRRLAESSVDELDRRVELTERERELARNVAELVARGVGAIIRDRPANQRLAQLETEMHELRGWRLRLTGVADTNGRFGVLERTVDQHREDTARALELIRIDLGPPEERQAERENARLISGIRRRLQAAVGVSVVALGGTAWGWISTRGDAKAAAAATGARIDLRLEHIERDLYRRGWTAATPDPAPRTP